MRTFSCPGKLFLAGEYAVLWGGMARVLAVGPRASASVQRRDDRGVHVLLADGRLSGTATRKGVTWSSEPPPAFHFAARTIDLALRAHGRDPLGFDVAFAASPLGPGGHKLGMGSSARATVLAAECARWALDERFDSLKLALLAHAEAQGGKGSGGDVATCFAGGLIRYRRYALTELLAATTTERLGASLASSPAVELSRIAVKELPVVFAFSGESASTRGLMSQVEARLDPTARLRFVTRSDALGAALEEGLVRSAFAQVKQATEDLERLLEELGPLSTPGIQRILGIARSYGCAAKISGAGGGDGCIVIAPSADAKREVIAGLEARGFLAMDLTIESGVRSELSHDPELASWIAAGR